MTFLRQERETLERFLPGLDQRLRAVPFETAESRGSPVIGLYRDAGGAGLLVPKNLDGMGATPLEAARIHRALGARSASLGAAIAMHNFSIATLVEYTAIFSDVESGEALLRSVATDGFLMASGFAEGIPSGNGNLRPTLKARKTSDGYVLRGSKKPCSLAYSMGILSSSALVEDQGRPRRAVVLVPGDAVGLERRPFWKTSVLAGAESEELFLNDVVIPEELLFFPENEAELDPVEVTGHVWFQMIVAASYLGVASALVERVVQAGKGSATERAMLGIELESAMSAVEDVARALGEGDAGADRMARACYVRFAAQGAIERTTQLAAELLGGMAFIQSPEVAMLLASARAIAFHPPSRQSASAVLAEHLAGSPIRVL